MGEGQWIGNLSASRRSDLRCSLVSSEVSPPRVIVEASSLHGVCCCRIRLQRRKDVEREVSDQD